MSSSECKIYFEKAGISSLQDMGRPGLQEFGVPLGGAADMSSYLLANSLVGNQSNEPCVEISLIGPSIQFKSGENIPIAITGADLIPKVNDLPVSLNKTIVVQKGDILTFKGWKYGCRSYLAIGGRWKTGKWNESVSPLMGFPSLTPDSTPNKGSEISIDVHRCEIISLASRETKNGKSPVVLHVVRGPEFELFSQEELLSFTSDTFTVSVDSNRMGCRMDNSLEGSTLKPEMISSGILPGTIQIAGSGKPIILLQDAQTTGGYPRIGRLIDIDLGSIAQCKPGDQIKFEWA